MLFHVFAQIRLQLIQRIEFADIFHELVVDFRQLFGFDLVQFALEHRGFAFQFFRVVIFGEGHIDFKFFIGVFADDLILETGDKLAGAQHQRVVLALAALEGFAIQEAFKIKGNGITVFRRAAFDRHQTRVALLQLGDFGIHIFIGHRLNFFVGFQTFVLTHFDFGFHGDDRFEHQAFGTNADNIQINFVLDILVVGLFDGFVQRFGIHIVHRVLIKHTGAVHFFHQMTGSFAFAEARNHHFFYL